MSDEEWRPIPGYEGRYEVSSEGRVVSLLRGRSYEMRGSVNWAGYRYVILSGPPRVIANLSVHKLVALAFIGPRPDGLQIRHLDGTRTNNAASNLVYGTASENMQDKLRHGTNDRANRTHCPYDHPYDEGNTYIGPTGQRFCRACHRRRNAEYQQRRALRAAGIAA